MRFLFGVTISLTLAAAVTATPVSEYRRQIRQAVAALDSLVQSEDEEDAGAYEKRRLEAIASLRTLLPQSETVEWNDGSFKVDHRWLQESLNRYEKGLAADREELLKDVAERLEAIEERLAEIEKPESGPAGNKAEASRKLGEILQRSEYQPKVDRGSAFPRLVRRFFKWLESFWPKSSGISAGSASVISKAAQIFVIALAVGVLAFVLMTFVPRFLRAQRTTKKRRAKARIVLGETLDPEQTALDLLAEAEALARRGELRAAIRKGYVALLVELGDRKLISLAQHKTNHDYLRALPEAQPLYRNVQQLTDSFERHWYGLIPASETDWQAFRTGYRQALSR
jgi:Domain of unknown function (DUF4129)